MTLDILNIASAIFGLVGTCLIFTFGIPNRVNTNGHKVVISENADEKEEKETSKYKHKGNIGLVLVIISFCFQLLIGFGIELKI